jgi:hypothetical protein
MEQAAKFGAMGTLVRIDNTGHFVGNKLFGGHSIFELVNKGTEFTTYT